MNIAIVLFFTISNALLWFFILFIARKQMLSEVLISVIWCALFEKDSNELLKLSKFYRTGDINELE